ncbi:RecQ-mediated genome instability protein 1 [Linum grandiflorum]
MSSLTQTMLRRRLVLSDDEDDEQENHQPPPRPPSPPQLEATMSEDEIEIDMQPSLMHQNPNRVEPVISISDEELVDVLYDDNHASPPSETVTHDTSENQQPQPQLGAAVMEESSGCPVGDILMRMGLRLKREWLDSCLGGLNSSLQHLDLKAKAKHCFDKFLMSDMNYCGKGVLPPNVGSMHLVDLPGPFVLQVDEIVNMSVPLKGRYQDAYCGLKRCLKLSMTDGVQRVFAIEYKPIDSLKVLAPAGFKVAISNVHVRRGLLMLVPEVIEILGGAAEELEAARTRLVAEVNKPPRGKRSKAGVIPPLATRGTMAAWPLTSASDPGSTNNSANAPGTSNPGHVNDTPNIPQHYNHSVNIGGGTNGLANVSRSATPSTMRPSDPSSVSAGYSTNPVNVTRSTTRCTVQTALSSYGRSINISRSTTSSVTQTSIPSQSDDRGRAEPIVVDVSDRVVSEVEGMHIDLSPVSTRSAIPVQGDTHMADQLEHPLILSGDREIPFTYLASLSAKWAAKRVKTSLQGRIKCLITAVKSFQYKHTERYDLRLHVDDGSLISEIMVDHSVVHKYIGSSPQEAASAISSTDANKVADMKNTLTQFQIFLLNFEGTMLVEMNGNYPVPVALELKQGVPATAAWLLMRRLKSCAPSPPTGDHNIETITLSP